MHSEQNNAEHTRLQKSFDELAEELSKLGPDPVYKEIQLYLNAAHQALRSKTGLQKKTVKG